MKRMVFTLLTVFCVLGMGAQRPDYAKMSTLVRQLSLAQEGRKTRAAQPRSGREPAVCAFVRIDGDGDALLRSQGCEPLMSEGDIWIASIPLSRLAPLSHAKGVRRIEAGRSNSIQTDTMATILNARKAYEGGGNLPQAYTGKGVVVGVMDIGFDLTHPNFYNADATEYRIKAFWDQLATDSNRYVGRDYEGEETLLALAHSRDGLDQTHGTHTLGIAAGGGWDPDEPGRYRGMAYESDICLVANASSEDAALIDSADYYKYTYATDVMGFKYLFDYAEAHGQPCVASFSEGSHEDFRGDDQLYYEMLATLVGKGRILVASAGNDGGRKTYFRKPAGVGQAGCFITPDRQRVGFTLKSAAPFTITLKAWNIEGGEQEVSTADILAQADSTLRASTPLGELVIAAYRSCYGAAEVCYDVLLTQVPDQPFSLKVAGADADVEYYQSVGIPTTNPLDASLNAGENTHSIHSPSSAPCVIAVGANGYREDIYTYLGAHRTYEPGLHGRRYSASSIGPTFDGRVKPDVVAPGVNIVSSYSSYYLENHPNAWDIENSDKKHFDFRGRTYAWNYNSGTSMATPAVAGAIALWLQAKPDLTPEEVMEVLSKTSTHPDASLTYPNNEYGYGQIDVYAGLLEVLNLTRIQDLSTHQPAGVTIRPAQGRRVQIAFDTAPARDFTVSVYSADGRKLLTRRLAGGNHTYELDLSDCPAGVYAVQVSGGSRDTTGSSLVRL
ncbi:S8 family serine peptidase [Prevotella sp. KH2C16]|uniref:S8 family serine peptidase n=1 Tax=Prevotella sp. KH2C16 TaxID=1855325 RepID=UPI000B8381DC|nr:S8 family serine peptidase [Prevotella sp. KH2C16]